MGDGQCVDFIVGPPLFGLCVDLVSLDQRFPDFARSDPRNSIFKVAECIEGCPQRWKEVAELWPDLAPVFELVKSIPIPMFQARDRRVWKASPSGKFSVRSASKLLEVNS